MTSPPVQGRHITVESLRPNRTFFRRYRITIFRDDLGKSASIKELESLSNRKRRARLDEIREACSAYITGPLNELLSAQLADVTGGIGQVEIDRDDGSRQAFFSIEGRILFNLEKQR